MKKLLALNLQRFAEDEEIEVDLEDAEEGEHEKPEHFHSPSPTPSDRVPTPRQINQEVWRNVEELFLTLNDNVRVTTTAIRDEIKKLAESTGATQNEILHALQSVSTGTQRLNELLSMAVVEPAPGEGKQDETPLEKPKRSGYASRKRR